MLLAPTCGALPRLEPLIIEPPTRRSLAEIDTEFYETPAWCVDRILERIGPGLPFHFREPGARWLDPCVGNGAIPAAVERHFPCLRWLTQDIRDTGHAEVVGDYLKILPANDQRADVCIMNPPFSLAVDFADKAMLQARVVIMLQRLNWLASDERQPWMYENRPAVYVLPNRPDFSGGGGDSQEYAWFVWGLGHREVDILDLTPAEIRKAQKPKRPHKEVARVVLRPGRAA